ncbi:MAG: hypothetical protein JRE23_18465 [Deltaproteobacteria bacterium]|nr:hypothetical protein [Deltaproteobacteria bacterium]
MKKEDEVKFKNLMALMQETFTPNNPVSSEKMQVYWDLFEDWSIEDFTVACKNVMFLKTISTFPLPGELQEAGRRDHITEQWLYVRSLISKHGHAMSLILPDPVSMSVIEAMGTWPEFTFTPTDQLVWKQKDFERLYPLMAKRDKHPAYLTGEYDVKHNMIDLRSGKQLSIEEAEKVIAGSNQIEGPDSLKIAE